MTSQELVPTIAGILMLVFGLAMAGAMIKGIVLNNRRRRWPSADGTVRTANGRDGSRNSLSIVDYTAPDGSRQRIELPTGTAGTNGKVGTIPLVVNPKDPAEAYERPKGSTFAAMGCFGALALFFSIFGLFALITVFTN